MMNSIVFAVVPASITGRAYLIQALEQRGLTLPEELISKIVNECIADAKETSATARKVGMRDLSSFRITLAKELNSVVFTMFYSKSGSPLDHIFHPKSVNDLLIERGFVSPPS
jgi:hypothetical protein